MLDFDFILCSLWSLLALLSVCIGIKNPSKCNAKSNFMTREYTDTLRWIACFVILLSHVPVPATYNLLGSFHFVAVTVFFLLSGYGLCNSLLIDKKSFIRKHPKRCMKLIVLFMIGWLVKIPFHSVVSSGGLLFIPLLLILYIAFGCCAVIYSNKSEYLFIIVVILVFIIGYPIASVLWLQRINPILGWGSSEIGFGIGIFLHYIRIE